MTREGHAIWNDCHTKQATKALIHNISLQRMLVWKTKVSFLWPGRMGISQNLVAALGTNKGLEPIKKRESSVHFTWSQSHSAQGLFTTQAKKRAKLDRLHLCNCPSNLKPKAIACFVSVSLGIWQLCKRENIFQYVQQRFCSQPTCVKFIWHLDGKSYLECWL